jgi:thiosulfate/3-mercaptopyruvate sulfurtransferase
MMNVIVQPRWLLARMYEPDLVIVDCRFQLGAPEAGRKAYEQDHIPGALYADLEADLSAPITEHGGRHPLPDTQSFAAFIGKLGIGQDTRVVAYDDQGGAFAARLWWLLRYHGHQKTYILDGGYAKWNELGYPVSDAKPPVIVPKTFVPDIQADMLVSMQDVRERLGNSGTLLIDSREPRRYRGEEEPIDRKAGHIPGARNLFWKDVLNSEGMWKSVEEQKQRLAEAGLDPNSGQEIIVYCGSGVTACPNVLALEQAGYRNVKLYAGSWSDWISYSENPVATGDE